MDVAGARRLALAEWQQLAGDIPVDWALANREEIQAAADLRREVDALGALSSNVPTCRRTSPATSPTSWCPGWPRCARSPAKGVPLLLDDPFQPLDPVGEAPAARAPRPLVRRAADHLPHRRTRTWPRWARLEALTGEVSLIEPAPAHEETAGPHHASGSPSSARRR